MSAPPRGPRGVMGTRKRGDDSVVSGAGRGKRGNVGSVASSSGSVTPRRGTGRGRARASQGHDGSKRGGLQPTPITSHSNTPDLNSAGKAFQKIDRNHMQARWEELRSKREVERATAIRKGLLADPTKKMSLAEAITPVGTCQEMCPLFERVERIYQQMVDGAEKIPDPNGGDATPSEAKMVKRFRRPAAGEDEQIPSDIRTPETLKRTLIYLLDEVVGGGARLASIHKFVWDRTRAIRNDFSIQQVTKAAEVQVAVDCFEHIVRFHILSLHQLSNPLNLDDENVFVAQQEREQLNKALLSLIYYYNDHRDVQDFVNEPEFRAYCILLELQSLQPDLLDRIQSWPKQVLAHPRVEKAFQLYSAAGSTLHENGPLKPREAFDLAQGNAARFWDLLKSKQVTYLMACVAEINFPTVRFTALQSLWKSVKRANAGVQSRMQDWTADDVARLLGYDEAAQAVEFCAEFGLLFKESKQGEEFLDFASLQMAELDQPSLPREQVFSYNMVETKRYHRTLSAVINGVSVAEAIRSGQVVESNLGSEAPSPAHSDASDENALFFRDDTRLESVASSSIANPFGLANTQNSVQSNPFGHLNAGLAGAAKPAGNPFNTTSTGTSIFGPNAAPATPIFGLGNATNAPSQPAAPSGGLSWGQSQTPAGSTFAQAPKSAAEGKSSATTFVNPFNTVSTTLKPTASIFTPQPPPTSSASPGTFGPATAPTGILGQTSTSNPFSGLGQTPALVPAPSKDLSSTPKNPFGFLSAPSTAPTSFRSANVPVPTNSFNASAVSGGGSMSNFLGMGAPPPNNPFTQDLATVASDAPTAQLPVPAPTWPPQAPISVQSPGEKVFSSPAPENKAATRPFADSFDAQKGHSAPAVTAAANSSSSPTPFQVKDDSSAPKNSMSRATQVVEPGTPDRKPLNANKGQSGSKPAASSPLQSFSRPPIQSVIPNLPQPIPTPTFKSTSAIPKHKSPLGSQQPLVTSETAPKVDLSRVEHNIATVAFLEDQGILQQFVEHSITSVVQRALTQYRAETEAASLKSLRTRVLSRKFFKVWKDVYWRNKLHRNAQRRRQRFSESARRDQSRVKYEVGMLDAQEAHRTREKFQAQQRDQINRLLEAGEEIDPIFLPPGQTPAEPKPAVNGLKRKSTHTQSSMPPPTGTPRRLIVNGHKRSRTMDGRALSKSDGHSKASDLAATARYNLLMSSPNGFRASTNSSLSRSASLGRKVDRTQTDHFRLKARGIDPGTPIFPDTKTSLERTKRSMSDRPSSARRRVWPVLPENASVPKIKAADPSPASPTPKKAFDPDQDEFLQQIRQLSRAMREDSEWFNTQTKELEKEIEVQEEANRSQQSSPPASDLTPNGSGFLTSVNGYLYSPAPQSSSAQSLSRTEQRIRKTGAHGFATRPVDEYLAVAQSKITGNQLRVAAKSTSRKKRKIKTRERDGRYIYSSDEDYDDEEVAEGVRHTPPSNRKRKKPSPEYVAEVENQLPAAPAPVLLDDANGKTDLSGHVRNSPALQNFFNKAALAADADEDPDEERDQDLDEEEEEQEDQDSEAEILDSSPVLRGAHGRATDSQFQIYDDENASDEDTGSSSSSTSNEAGDGSDGDDYNVQEDVSVSAEDAHDDEDGDGDTESLASNQDPRPENPAAETAELDGEGEIDAHQDSPGSLSAPGSASFHMRLRSQSPLSQARLGTQTQTVLGESVGSPGSGMAGASVEDALVLSD